LSRHEQRGTQHRSERRVDQWSVDETNESGNECRRGSDESYDGII
jgi:hypothetical protein